jgi:hypothetical protein
MKVPLLEEYQKNLNFFESAHYIFSFTKGSLAEKDIQSIASGQEKCRRNFLEVFNVESRLKIQYYFFTTALECGKQYRLLHKDEYSYNDPDEEVNGYTSYPDKIFATYNDTIPCIGYHEDVHLLMAEQYGNLKSCFVKEGIATFFDKVWWGIDNLYWAKVILEKGIIKYIESLYYNEEFFKYKCMYTYPIAGAFTEWLIEKIGIDEYKKYYQAFIDKLHFPENSYRQDLVNEFIEYMKNVKVEKEIKDQISTCIIKNSGT